MTVHGQAGAGEGTETSDLLQIAEEGKLGLAWAFKTPKPTSSDTLLQATPPNPSQIVVTF